MGDLHHQAPQEPIIQDLKVSIQDSSLIIPPHQTHDNNNQNKSIFLSNIDQVLNFHVQTLHFFQANPDFPPETAAASLKNGLEKLMAGPYDFLAGRLKPNHQTGRLEIECNGMGAGFVVASSEYSLDEIGDLVYPNPGFMQLIVPGLEKFLDQPLGVFQVTSFKCGSFALGVSTNHILFDGMSFKTFLQNLASQSLPDDRPLAAVPCNDRRLLAARSPPRVTFPHPELQKLDLLDEQNDPPPVFNCSQADLDFRIFHLSPDNISRLKTKAGPTKATGFNAVAALVWRCKALSSMSHDRESVILYAVDIRQRLVPPLPAAYCGNAVLSAHASASCPELADEAFGETVRRVAAGAARMTDEYARSVIDWGELHKGFPHGEFLISSWWRLGFDEVGYPWGMAKYSCPVVYPRKDIVLLFPEMRVGDGGSSGGGGGVNVLAALPPDEMEKFSSLFHEYISG
ncbi:HXXXD-type acyl-transferase family protein [Striga hermonthica]|uniref:HXXXD-type acyl-transferase family protein n=1 Tax=Striga hermonthica TaxID=68872 RepID=A0A9N7RRK5_STRHE|nr:HXXXD-type acyl-transferase family protein [Striga hermonthica]